MGTFSPDLTEAAQRAVTAATSDTQAVHSLDLFWALVDQESRAADILTANGLDAEKLAPRLPRLQVQHRETVPDIEDVLHEALKQVPAVGRGDQLGTEHLLWGLAHVDPVIETLLADHGLDSQTLLPLIDAAAGTTATPLQTDEQLQFGDPPTNRVDVHRVLDAASNRAREGLRVVEDVARFVLDDQHLTSELKRIRHALVLALEPLDDGRFLASRDTQQDVGTDLSDAAEYSRGQLRDIVNSNFGRIQEAVRTLEEFAKLSVGPSSEIEQIRYRLYTLHKALGTTLEAQRRLENCRLYLLATESSCRAGLGPAVRGAIAGGVNLVQLREKSLADRELLVVARRIRDWTRAAEVLFVMNDRPDLAVLSDADGVHVGQDELDVRSVRRLVGPGRLIGVSTHSIEQARQAVLDGADYLGVGPVFPSDTKSFDELAGLEFVRQVAEEISLPWYAIGGITAENIDEVIEAGARRVAVSATICAAEDAASASHHLGRLLAAAQEPPGDSG